MIAPSTSQWRIPYFLVEKKGIFHSKQKKTLVFYCRRVNELAKTLQYRLDSFNQILDYLAEAKSSYYSIIDLRNAVWQVPVSERTSEICTFESSSGLHGIRCLITRLASSSNVFQHLLEVIMAGLRPANVLIGLCRHKKSSTVRYYIVRKLRLAN
jgi:hypothetical protein